MSDVATALLAAVASRVDVRGAHFTQCLLDPGDTIGRATLEGGGFPRVTELILLNRPLAGRGPQLPGKLRERPSRLKPPDDAGLSVETYSPAAHAAFSRIVERTYVDTLDCPVLARVRGGEESLDAHRATGQFVPAAWRLYCLAGEEVGVLILAEHPDRDTWEVAYLGVVPEARGRGIGRAILDDGLALAKRSGRATIEIAVDSSNTPALRLYRNLGFTDVRRFEVHLRVAPALRRVPKAGAAHPTEST